MTVTARSPEARAMQVPLADRTNTRASSEDDAPPPRLEDASVVAPAHGAATQAAAGALLAMGAEGEEDVEDSEEVLGVPLQHTATDESVDRARALGGSALDEEAAPAPVLLPPPRGALIELVGRASSLSDARSRRVRVTNGTQLPYSRSHPFVLYWYCTGSRRWC